MMRKIELNHIELSGEVYPVYCDIYVLEKIQERMPISEFERQLIGRAIKRDDHGRPMYNEDGSFQLVPAAQNLQILVFAATVMINEGIEIQNDQDGTDLEPLTEKYVARIIDMNYVELTIALHHEFNRCFGSKKKEAAMN